jgi:hypothetical protein
MATITVDDISIYKNNSWRSIKDQQAYVNWSWQTIGDGSGVYKDGNWYVFDSIPKYTVTYSTNDSRDTLNVWYRDSNNKQVIIPSGSQVKSGTTIYTSGTTTQSNYRLDHVIGSMGGIAYYYADLHDSFPLNNIVNDADYDGIFSVHYYSIPYATSDANIRLIINNQTSDYYGNINFKLIGTSHEGIDTITLPFQSINETDDQKLVLATPFNGCTLEFYLEDMPLIDSMPQRIRYTYEATNYNFNGYITRDDLANNYEDKNGNYTRFYIGTDGINSGALILPITDEGSTLTLNILR